MSIWFVLVFCLVPSSASANFGVTSEGGQIVAEPIGGSSVVVRQESLTIDLRPLAEGAPAHIEASYRLQNPGPAKNHNLVFVSGAPGVTGFLAAFDGQPLESSSVQGFVPPEEWKVPDDTPGIDGGALSYRLDVSAGSSPALACAVVLASGPHEMTVRYEAEAMVNHISMPIVARQFVYLLSPARSWAGFERLEVAVLLPAGWQAASSPTLQRDGDVLRGSFAGMPADAIAVTVRAPEGWWYRPLVTGSGFLVLVVAAAGIPFCVLRGRAAGRRLAATPEAGRTVMPGSLLSGFLWWLAVVAATLLYAYVPDLTLPASQLSANQRTSPLYVIIAIFAELALIPLGFTISRVTAAIVIGRALARARRRETERTLLAPEGTGSGGPGGS